VSQASRDELLGFWRWQGIERPPPVEVLALGADFNSRPRVTVRPPSSVPRLLCTGILEPRKNQSFLLEVCDALWTEGLKFELHLVGRVNPHFGPPIVAQIKTLRRKHPRLLQFHEAATDAALLQLYATARATVFPTIAEGCGLPLLESLWMGVPCACSDLPVLRENADAGGCLKIPANDRAAWKKGLRALFTDDALHAKLTAEATSRPLPTWSTAAQALAAGTKS
jgi:glycosyltransferase involved in cell wall biosynthesis